MNWSKSKYENQEAMDLYASDPDESIGSVDELGWAARFNDELAILVEDYVGFVWLEKYESATALNEAWAGFEKDYEEYDLGILV